MSTFDLCMKFTGLAEGGYTKLPGDKGGETKFGISDARDGKLDGRVSGIPAGFGSTVSVPVKQLTREQADSIYRAEYYSPIRGDELHPAVACAVFDFGVNSGTVRAVKALQRCCGVAQDGVSGPVTVAAANKLEPRALSSAICNVRREFLRTSKASTVIKYRDALLARVTRCETFCGELV